jgi:hypothetical protein
MKVILDALVALFFVAFAIEVNLDISSTKGAIKRGAYEANPVMARLMAWFPNAWPYIKAALSLPVMLAVICFASGWTALIVLMIASVGYFYVWRHNYGVNK